MDKKRYGIPAGLMAATLALAACGDPTGVNDPSAVSLSFRVSTDAPALVAEAPAMVPGPPLDLEGTNGTLTLDEVHLIVAEVELEGDDDACDDDVSGMDDDCMEFEAPPRFLELPLDGTPVAAVTAVIPPGTYDELEFEIEDLEDDEEDPGLAAAIAVVRAEVLDEFPDWPLDASARITGSFTPAEGDPVAFTVYVDAEIEIEMALAPPLVVGDDGASSRELTVDVQPELWFARPDGTVLPLHLYDYATTGELLELEVEMEDGFREVEIG